MENLLGKEIVYTFYSENQTVEGKYSRLGVGNDLFNNAKTISRIIAIILIFIGLNIWFIVDFMSYHYDDIIFD